MITLNINFLNEKATADEKKEFFVAVKHEETQMLKTDCEIRIEKLEKSLKKEDISNDEIKALKTKLTAEKEILATLNDIITDTKPTHSKVLADMTKKNENHFGNKPEVVRNVLRVLATWENSKLVKYALVETFKGEALRDALEDIHVNSQVDEHGCVIAAPEVKAAYKKASNELESIIKNTFSLPFESTYTTKTRVKITAEDKRLLHNCYVKGFKNKMNKNEATEVVDFAGREIVTAVKSKKDKRTGQIIYNYSGLYQIMCQIVMKHYFK